MLAVRGPVYAEVAKLAVDTTSCSRDEVVEAVAAHVRATADAGLDLT